MFDKIRSVFSKKLITVTAQLNDKIMPVDRGDFYEDPLDEFLQANNFGEIEGGGTMQSESGEIEFCDVSMLIKPKDFESKLPLVIQKLEELGAPKGSKMLIHIDRKIKEIEFGKREGLAIYLDGRGLPDHIYKENDINSVYEKLIELTNTENDFQRYWERGEGTVLYFYGESFEIMKNAVVPYLQIQPLCQNARIVQIA